MTPDEHVLAVTSLSPNLLVPHFLIHSYLYYVLDRPLVSDDCFDELVRRLGEAWEVVEHPHKGLIDPSLLKSGFYLQYPERVKWAALDLERWWLQLASKSANDPLPPAS